VIGASLAISRSSLMMRQLLESLGDAAKLLLRE
jgi:hypothetical protein